MKNNKFDLDLEIKIAIDKAYSKKAHEYILKRDLFLDEKPMNKDVAVNADGLAGSAYHQAMVNTIVKRTLDILRYLIDDGSEDREAILEVIDKAVELIESTENSFVYAEIIKQAEEFLKDEKLM